MGNWIYEKDAYGDDSWGKQDETGYQELRVYPTKTNWGLYLLKARSPYSSDSTKRLLKSGTKEEVINFAKRYIKKL
jgi:hypothetical protein